MSERDEDFSFANYSEKELIDMRNKLEFENGKVIEEWSAELSQKLSPNFDPYSYFGEKKLRKLTKRFADKTAEILDLIEEIEIELKKRDNLKYQRMFDGKANDDEKLTNEEFMEKESLKTLKYKNRNQS